MAFLFHRAAITRIYKSSAVAKMGDHLATIDMGHKVGEGCCAPFCWDSWVPI